MYKNKVYSIAFKYKYLALEFNLVGKELLITSAISTFLVYSFYSPLNTSLTSIFLQIFNLN